MNDSQFGVMLSQQDYFRMKDQLQKVKKTYIALKKQNDTLKKQIMLKDLSFLQNKQLLKERNSQITYLAAQLFKMTHLFTKTLTENDKLKNINTNIENEIKTLKQQHLIKIESINQKVHQLQQQASKLAQQNKLLIEKCQKHGQTPQLENNLSSDKQQSQRSLKNIVKEVQQGQQQKAKLEKLQKQTKKYKQQRDEAKKQYKSLYQTNQGLFKFNEQQGDQIDKLKKQLKTLKAQKAQMEKKS